MRTHNLGYPRIGSQRELKKHPNSTGPERSLYSNYYRWVKPSATSTGSYSRTQVWTWYPATIFSFYDSVLDTCLMTGTIPQRYHGLMEARQLPDIDLLFAMARGYQKDGYDVTAMEMTKWFDTNYHYLVPEFTANQQFTLYNNKVLNEFLEATEAGFQAKPVLLGPVSFLLLGKEKEAGFHRLELIRKLLPVYLELIGQLDDANVHYIQFDEPCLSLDLTEQERQVFTRTYTEIKSKFPHLHLLLASYFECYGSNLPTVLALPVQTLHLDLVRCPMQLEDILATDIVNSRLQLSLGVVDGRNVWKNDFRQSLSLIHTAVEKIGADRVWIAPSCSLLHAPCSLETETNLNPDLKQWLAFAKEKVAELVVLKQLATDGKTPAAQAALEANTRSIESRRTSPRIHNPAVQESVNALTEEAARRQHAFALRREMQQAVLQLPLFPTTTIGSFPQTAEVRSWRAKWKKGELTDAAYDEQIARETAATIQWQEAAGIDVLVHGEFERNDMVEYFGEQLDGFLFTQNGWVQSYGSRCVKPPIIFGDVRRPAPMTIRWTAYAQSLTSKWVKGMLTGPVTILQWSFVRNDQPRSQTCMQIALAIRDEVTDLEKAGIRIIQIDEPAIREGLPLRKEHWQDYLDWAVKAFRIAASGVQDHTQIHTHMCYSEFNDIIRHIADMDADVITIECSRSQMELLDAFAEFKYPNEIGPGVYDIHSPRVPDREEMIALLEKARAVVPDAQLWVNPDCGLKTRQWPETRKALVEMVAAAQALRQLVATASVK